MTSADQEAGTARERLASYDLGAAGSAEEPRSGDRAALSSSLAKVDRATRDRDRVRGRAGLQPVRKEDVGAEPQLHGLRQRGDDGQGLDGDDHLDGLGERQAPERQSPTRPRSPPR